MDSKGPYDPFRGGAASLPGSRAVGSRLPPQHQGGLPGRDHFSSQDKDQLNTLPPPVGGRWDHPAQVQEVVRGLSPSCSVLHPWSTEAIRNMERNFKCNHPPLCSRREALLRACQGLGPDRKWDQISDQGPWAPVPAACASSPALPSSPCGCSQVSQPNPFLCRSSPSILASDP